MSSNENRRILVIDDQESIREDFRKILGGSSSKDKELEDARAAFFGDAEADAEPEGRRGFEMLFAGQGEEGVEIVRSEVQPIAMAFVDVRMPPGIDGVETIQRLWKIDPELEVVICTAYSDYTHNEMVKQLGDSDRLLLLKKPFDPVEVRQLAETLTKKWNTARSLERQMEELRAANERAETASRAKSEFLANMSHEIRTPMNALLGYVDLLCDPDVTSEQQASYGQTIRASGEHLLTILNDILDLSRIEAGRMVMNVVDFTPLDVVREVASLMLPQANEKDLDLRIEAIGPIPTTIEGDRVRVRQVLLNLIGNAIKFTPHGSVRVLLSHDADAGGVLSFSVVDTGVGIPESEQEQLFEAFTQADNSLTRSVGGTGLGLTISRRLARLLGGDVQLDSTPEHGSSFTFRMNVGPVPADRLVTYGAEDFCLEGPTQATRRAARPDSLQGRILVVEDVKFNQILIGTVLRKAGAVVAVADDGRAGCEEFQRAHDAGEPYDLVIMDMQMPVMDGYEATRQLRAAGHQTPIIAVTAHAMAGDREKCSAAGCTDYATKPIDRIQLIDVCHRMLTLEGTLPPLPADEEAKRPTGT